jgi:carboxymethylenebutenolidase
MKTRRLFAAALLFAGCLVAGCQSSGEQKPDEKEKMADKSAKEGETDAGDESMADKMADEHEGDEPIPSGAIEGEPRQPVTAEQVDYAELDGETVSGYLAKPKETEGTAPGIIVIQEWWGLNDNIRKMTELLAGEGYSALAVDLYEGKVAESPDKARSLMQEAMGDKDRLRNNLRQAYQYLDQEVGAENIGVIGWCFGGGWSLQTALMLPDKIDATVIYYGELTANKEKLKKLDMPILGLFGSEDTAVPPATVDKFEAALQDLEKEANIHIYEGANHAFANPSGERYDAEAAQDAWEKTVKFLAEHLKESDGGEGE